MANEQFRNKYKRFLETVLNGVKWIARAAILALLLVAALNAVFPEFLSALGRLLGFEGRPSLAAVFGVAVLSLILERVLVIEDEMKRRDVQTFRKKQDAYDALPEFAGARVSRVDLIQFSGYSALAFLGKAAKVWPKAKIRMLLYHPGSASKFDSDVPTSDVDHITRIRTVLGELKLMKKDQGNDLDIQARFYRTDPSVSAVILDDKAVNLSWYRVYPDSDNSEIFHLRGHNSAAITAKGEAAFELISFAREQFDALWAKGENPLKPD
ncbi:MAG: hypothetical protein DMF67_05760 [Acidobacteria bacterium]|nr:MAG: hypothetical protein DMF67_05760 [Acidobacteriota bacterium]